MQERGSQLTPDLHSTLLSLTCIVFLLASPPGMSMSMDMDMDMDRPHMKLRLTMLSLVLVFLIAFMLLYLLG